MTAIDRIAWRWLQVAISKYGNHLSVNGSDDFRKSVVQAAVQQVASASPSMIPNSNGTAVNYRETSCISETIQNFNIPEGVCDEQIQSRFQENRNAKNTVDHPLTRNRISDWRLFRLQHSILRTSSIIRISSGRILINSIRPGRFWCG